MCAVTAPRDPRASGSRTAAYLMAWATGTIPALFVLAPFVGVGGAVAALVIAWCTGIVWLLKRRQEDPGWDRRPTTGHRTRR
ncbi:hypothetical protein GCM10009719_23890 [Nocardioides kribbensis]